MGLSHGGIVKAFDGRDRVKVRKQWGGRVVTDASDDPTFEKGAQPSWPVVASQLVWLAVIETAIEDSCRPALGATCQEARAWLESDVFEVVCEYLSIGSREGFDAEAIRGRMRRRWRFVDATGKPQVNYRRYVAGRGGAKRG